MGMEGMENPVVPCEGGEGGAGGVFCAAHGNNANRGATRRIHQWRFIPIKPLRCPSMALPQQTVLA